MERRELGRTGLTVSPIGLGLAALGRPGYINLGHAADLGRDYDPPAMEARAHEVLDAALAGGVRYFDVARSYGRGEEFLASWLHAREISRDQCCIGSKWGYTYTAAWRVDAPVHETKEHTLATFSRQVRETREHLGAWLALYQVHSATLDSGVLDDPRLLEAMAGLRADGTHVGLTLSGPKQAETLKHAMTVQVDGRALFETVQATWNVLERSAEQALADAHAAGMGVIIKEALANGRLTGRNTVASFAKPLTVLRAHAARLQTSIDALAIAAALQRPWADVVLSGASSVAQLRSNLAARAVTLDDEARRALAGLAESPADYWSVRSRLPWN